MPVPPSFQRKPEFSGDLPSHSDIPVRAKLSPSPSPSRDPEERIEISCGDTFKLMHYPVDRTFVVIHRFTCSHVFHRTPRQTVEARDRGAWPQCESPRLGPRCAFRPHHGHPERSPVDHCGHRGSVRPLFRQLAAVLARPPESVRPCRSRTRPRRRNSRTSPAGGRVTPGTGASIWIPASAGMTIEWDCQVYHSLKENIRASGDVGGGCFIWELHTREPSWSKDRGWRAKVEVTSGFVSTGSTNLGGGGGGP